MLEAEQQVLERNKIGISIADPTHSRLVEGIAVQLSLEPLFLESVQMDDAKLLSTVAILVADEKTARHFRSVQDRAEQVSVSMQPALVAVVPEAKPEFADKKGKNPETLFDGLLVLPQSPQAVLAQLSVILYAHRSVVQRFGSAMDELMLNRRIFRSVTSGISVATAHEPDLPLTYVNPAFEVITGYSLEEIQGKNCRFLQGEEREQPGLVLVREAIAEKRKTVVVLRNYRKDGTPFWNELSLSPIFDKGGNLTHFVGIQNDVTERVAFEEALRESEKLATAGRLAASIAHEINNPLESITNLIYLARSEKEDAAKDRYLDEADKELRRVGLLTSQSLRFYRQSSRPQAVKPTELVTSVLDVYSVKLRTSGIQVDRRDRFCDSIVCLESEIRQVLSNLVRNAMDAMQGHGGRLLIRVREAQNWNSDVRGVAITVADTGHGMSQETQDRLFQPFYTTKGTAGTGLGLWVSHEIVQRHHGRTHLRSKPGEGTVFSLFLPYQAMAPERMTTIREHGE